MPEFTEPGHNPADEPENVEHVEKKLSPEIIQRIMDKVQDIDTPGIGYTTLRIEEKDKDAFFRSVIEFGLLGASYFYFDDGRLKGQSRVDSWRGAMRDKYFDIEFTDDYGTHLASHFRSDMVHNPSREKAEAFDLSKMAIGRISERKIIEKSLQPDNVIHFNIVGRLSDHDRERKFGTTELSSSTYATEAMRVTILFDLASFQEVENTEIMDDGDKIRFKRIGLKKYEPMTICNRLTTNGVTTGFRERFSRDSNTNKINPDSEYGFLLSPRIAPRLFRGVVVTGTSAKGNAREDSDPKSRLLHAREVATTMQETYRERPELLLPIYDVTGNLLWPQQMSYEDVKKFVSERTKKESEK